MSIRFKGSDWAKIRKASWNYLRLNWSTWLLYIVPLGVSIAILLSCGPYLQYALFNPIESLAPSIAEGIEPRGDLAVPPLGDWFFGGIYGPYVLIGIFAAWNSLNGKYVLRMAFFATIIIFVGLMLTDTFNEVRNGSISTNSFSQNVIANLLGTILIFLTISIWLTIYDYLSRQGQQVASSMATGGLAIIVTAILLSSLIYGLLFFVFQPLATSVEGRASIPFQGIYVGQPRDDQNSAEKIDGSRGKSFTLVPRSLATAKLEFEGAEGESLFDWQKTNSNSRFRLNLYILEDCISLDQVHALGEISPVLSADSVDNLSIGWDSGNLGIESTPFVRSSFDFYHPYPTFYWITENPEENDGAIRISNFMAEEGVVTGRFAGPTRLFFRASLMKSESDSAVQSKRELTLKIDGKEYRYGFTPKTTLPPDTRLTCRKSQASQGTPEIDANDTSISSVLVELDPAYLDDGSFSTYDAEIDIRGLQGWAAIEDIQRAEFDSHNIGTARFMSIEAVDSLRVGEQKIDIEDGAEILVYGDLYLSASGDGNVEFQGTSDRIWVNFRLLNQSYWDSLSIEVKITLISWIGAIVWLLRLQFMKVLEMLKRRSRPSGIPKF